MKHETQVISVRAPVDKLIIPVVKALLAFPEVATLYSCQGVAYAQKTAKEWNFIRDSSYVIFTAGGGSVIELAVFLNFLSERVSSMDCYAQFELPIVGVAPQIELHFQQEHISKMAIWLRAIRKEWPGLRVELKSHLSKFR